MISGELPEFARPPVVETVLSVRFREVPGFGLPQIVKFWDAHLVDDFPHVDQRAPYEAQPERFGADGQPPFSVAFGSEFPSPRLCFSGGETLIQMQPDWFAYNWRRVDHTATYNRYRTNRAQFQLRLQSLIAYVAEMGGLFVPLQCEVTYVNHIPLEDDDLTLGPFGAVLNQVRPQHGEVLPTPEGASFAASYIIDIDDRSVGRLHLKADRAWAADAKRPLLVLNLTARGSPLGHGIDGVLDFCDLGRQWIVAGFKDMTSNEFHKRWGYQGRQA